SSATARLASVALLSLGLAGCFTSDEEQTPPRDSFDFPTGLAVSPGRHVLYVANSDFDLHYNGGTVLALNLDTLRKELLELQAGLMAAADSGNVPQALDNACATVLDRVSRSHLAHNDNRILSPGPCTAFTPPIENAATIGAFASGLLLVRRPDASGS